MNMEEFHQVAEKIAMHGGRIYLVGGAIRDIALKKAPHDMDFCVTGLSSDEFQELFDSPRVQGKAFPVFIINGCEVALARTERKIGVGHTEFEIRTDKAITIEEDLARRDLTINSMAMDVLTGELIDPFHGLDDLKDGILRMTTKAYQEDPLRVYRTARFAAKFGFNVEEETLKMMAIMKDELNTLSVERVSQEFRKALLTKHPSYFFETLKKANVLDVHFPEVAKLIGVEQPAMYHPEGDAYVHTMEVLERATERTPSSLKMYFKNPHVTVQEKLRKPNVVNNKAIKKKYKLADTAKLLERKKTIVEQREMIRFCALVHDFGKILTPQDEWPHHYGHEENGVPVIQAFCKSIKMPKAFEKAGVLTSRLHMNTGRLDELKSSTRVKIFSEIEQSRSLSYEGMEIVASCDSKKDIKFAQKARAVMKIGMTPEIKEICTVEGVFDFEKAKNMVLNKRVEVLKSIEASNNQSR